MGLNINVDFDAFKDRFNSLREQYSKLPEVENNQFTDSDGSVYNVDPNSNEFNVFDSNGNCTFNTVADKDNDGTIDYAHRIANGVEAEIMNIANEDFDYARYIERLDDKTTEDEGDSTYVTYKDYGNDGVLDSIEFSTSNSKVEYQFDENGKVISYSNKLCDENSRLIYAKTVSDESGIEGKPLQTTAFEYNEDGYLTQELIDKDSDGVIDSKRIYERNEDNETQSVTEEKYDNGKLSSSSTKEYVLDDDGKLSKVIETTVTYDNEGNVIDEVTHNNDV